MTPPALKSPLLPQTESRLAAQLGLRCDESVRERLAEGVARHRSRLGLSLGGEAAYLERLDRDPGERRALAQELAVGETFFFRGQDHFAALAAAVLPEVLRARASERRLRVLSAACASGEEAYSLAILLREALPESSGWTFDILGVDINSAFLAKAAHGVYTPWSLRDVPREVVRRWFRAEGRLHRLDPAIRALAHFREIDLLEPGALADEAPFDVVFCRNLFIYLTPAAIATVLRRLQGLLAPGGYLFLGHSETLRGFTRAFDACHSDDAFYYRLRDAQAIPADPECPIGAPSGPEALEPATESAAWLEAIERSAARVTQLTQANHASPAPKSVTATEDAEETWREALALLRQERYAEAAARTRGGEEPRLLLILAVALRNQNRTAEAEQACRRALAIAPADAEAMYQLAVCREHDGDAAGALHCAQQAIICDPGFAMPWLLVARLGRRSGDSGVARRALEEALRLLPQQSATRTFLFAGGFPREALIDCCLRDLAALRETGTATSAGSPP